ncbi:hypothetical protein F4778DRAFT_697777 [Xylariomycetidae sp. FL2044]|nr:hypothetical protein F4778DRAFT_697777 [Xylariomycetidae sp. FL2044]
MMLNTCQLPATAPRSAQDTSRKTRSGRIAKNAPTRAEALAPDRRRDLSGLDMLEESGDSAQTAPQHRKRQRKTYQRERASRRLAGQLPEYGMLLGRGEAPPLYEASLATIPK